MYNLRNTVRILGIDIDNTITDTLPKLKEYCKKYNDEFVKRGLQMHENGYSSYNLYDWTKEENMGFFALLICIISHNGM